MVEQPGLFAPLAEPLGPRVRKVVLQLLSRSMHPSAWELVDYVERQVGLKARWEIEHILETLAKKETQFPSREQANNLLGEL